MISKKIKKINLNDLENPELLTDEIAKSASIVARIKLSGKL